MKARFLFGLSALLVGSPLIDAHGCLWDRDTLAQEAKGIPDVVRVITGRFERNPPRFYEMRLERIEAKFDSATDSEKLFLSDDAGVACDRLHRGDEAIAWMERKHELLETLPESDEIREHRYRYHANLGTFVIHRWLRDGASRDQIAEAERARALIATAIKLNPDAHFGREKYQLMAIEWLIDLDRLAALDPDLTDFDPRCFVESTGPLPLRERGGIEDAVEGIAGLIALGDAWESIDVFHALETVLLNEDHHAVAHLAESRIAELRGSGSRSLFPSDVDTGYRIPNMSTHQEATERFFHKARAEADTWQAARHQFMEEQFDGGKHPDTHPEFWEGFSYSGKAPTLPDEISNSVKRWIGLGVILFCVLVSMLLTMWLVRRLIKRYSDSPSVQIAIVLGGIAVPIVVLFAAAVLLAVLFD